MLDQLLKLVEQNATQSIVANKAIPDQLNNAAIKEVTNQIFNGLQGQVSQGKITEVIGLFHAGQTKNTHPVMASISETVTSNLATKFNLTPEAARAVANQIVPAVMSTVIKRTNDPRDIDFDLQQMLRRMTGNNNLDITDMIPAPQKTTIGSISQVFSKLFK